MIANQKLGQYRLLEEIGRGGMAVVYKAYQPTLDRYVAIKVLPHQFTFDREFVERFLREARAAARLNHPHIVTIHDVGEANGTYFIVMEYLEGPSLADLLRQQGALPPQQAAQIVAQVASALDYAHGQGFVHRDVKPSNVLLGAGGMAKLTDFGIVRAAEGTRLTQTGTLLGTPEYMSPEHIRGRGVDARSDIYSLGVVAYEMLTGRVPFSGDTMAVLHAHVYEPPDLSVLPAGIGPVVERALAKEPEERFESAGTFAQALGQAVVTWAGQERAERLRTLYEELHKALKARRWEQAVALGTEIQSLQPGYRDTAALLEQARDEWQQAQQAWQQIAQVRAALEAEQTSLAQERQSLTERQRCLRQAHQALKRRERELAARQATLGRAERLLDAGRYREALIRLGQVPAKPTRRLSGWVWGLGIGMVVMALVLSAMVLGVVIRHVLPAGQPALVIIRDSDTGTWTRFTDCGPVTDMLFHRDRLWIATLSGIVVWDVRGGTYVTYTRSTTQGNLASDRIRAILEDSHGNLWLGTEGGVSRRHGIVWTTFTVKDSPAFNNVHAIYEDKAGNLWFGTEGGLSHYDGESWMFITTEGGLVSDNVRAIYEDEAGYLWFGAEGGASRWDGSTWTTFTTENGLADNDIRAIHEDEAGNLWFGTEGGASRWDGSTWTTFTTENGLADNDIRAIHEDEAGNLWLGTLGGASRWDGDTWTTFTTDDGLAHNDVWVILEDEIGNLWFGTQGENGEGGITRLESRR